MSHIAPQRSTRSISLFSSACNVDSLSLTQLQDKVILLLCVATMFRPRSDIDTLQRRDIEFTFENNSSSRNQSVPGMTLHIKNQRKLKPKQQGLEG